MKATPEFGEEVVRGESLEQVKDRLALWRKGRKRGERISNALWAAAVCLVEQHGVQRTAQELGVDCDVLKKHIAHNACPTRTAKTVPQFVELFAQPVSSAAASTECVVEMENGRGGKMRVELNNINGLTDITGDFWGAR